MIEILYNIVCSYFTCFCLDKTSIILYKKYNNNSLYSQNVRWFFIHFIINLYVTIYGFSDIKYSITHISECAITKWTNGLELYITVIVLHFYHIFNFKLNKMDWLHHISMAIISAPLILMFNRTCSSTIGLWFTSGLPGAIDYFLLWLVKMGLYDKNLEKKIYIYINIWLRSPGCIYATILQLGFLTHIDTYSFNEILAKVWLIFILFWNGQFFMHTTLKDYYTRKVLIN